MNGATGQTFSSSSSFQHFHCNGSPNKASSMKAVICMCVFMHVRVCICVHPYSPLHIKFFLHSPPAGIYMIVKIILHG
jgi:hypothetical protein